MHADDLMYLLLSDLAHDRVVALAQERRHLRSSQLAAARSRRRRAGPVRRAVALVLVRISLASATAVRRLDDCLADDLFRPMTTRPDGA